jgi:hypothetical protein
LESVPAAAQDCFGTVLRTRAQRGAAAAEHTDGYHDSYLKVFTLIRDRDKTIATAFNDPRRSNAFILLANIKHEGLLTAAELDQFSPEARQAIDVIESVWRA